MEIQDIIMKKAFITSLFVALLFLLPVVLAHEETSHTQIGSRVSLSLSDENPLAGENVVLDFYVSENNVPVTDIQIDHEVIMHIVGVRDDLNNFFHIHPLQEASGHFVVNYTFPEDGKYTLWSEFVRNSEHEVHAFDVNVGVADSRILQTDFATEKTFSGYNVVLRKGIETLVSGSEMTLGFDIDDASTGDPVPLGMHLGETMHAFAISTDLKNFIHLHGGEHDEMHPSATGHFVTGRHAEEGVLISNPQQGHEILYVTFQEAGTYKLFVEFIPATSSSTKPVIAEFYLNVAQGAGANLFILFYTPLFILTIIATILIANYSKTGRITFFLKKVATSATPMQTETATTEVSEGEKKVKKILLIIGFLLFSVFIIGMVWLAVSYDPNISTTDFGFWAIVAYTSGLSMIFLPCTLPLAFVIVPLSMGQKPKKGFLMAVMFGLGLIITITSYGVIMASIGQIIGVDKATLYMWLIAGTIAFFLGLAYLKLIPLKIPGYSGAMPSFFQKGGDYLKAFFMGLFLGNAGAGCPNPAFYVLLAQIVSYANISAGASLGFIHGIGRAIPLLFLSIAGIIGINATVAIVKHKEKVEKGIGFALASIGIFILMLGIYGKAWWENSMVHKVWSELLSLINPQFGEAAAGAGTGPLVPFYVLIVGTGLVFLWYYLDRRYFSVSETVEGVAMSATTKIPKKSMEEKMMEELKKLEEREAKLEELSEREIKELEEIKSELKKKSTRGRRKK